MRTMLEARKDCQPTIDQWVAAEVGRTASLQYDSDSQAALDSYQGVVMHGVSASQLASRGNTGDMLALRRWEEKYQTDVHLHWSPAQHNIPHTSDRQNETAVIH